MPGTAPGSPSCIPARSQLPPVSFSHIRHIFFHPVFSDQVERGLDLSRGLHAVEVVLPVDESPTAERDPDVDFVKWEIR